MGARPSQFRTAGGFLNNVDGVIADYEFTTEFPGGDSKKKKSNSDFTPLYFLLKADVDGNDETQTQTLFVGDADAFQISDDGHVLTPVDGDGDPYETEEDKAAHGLRTGTPFFEFINSLVDNGFPESNLPEDEIDFSPIIGTRVRFVQVAEIDKKTNKPRMRKAKKGKYAGKEFPVTNTQVAQVYALPGDEEKKSSKPAAKGSNGKGKAAPAPAKGKTTSKGKKSDEGDGDQETAVETLLAILNDNDGEIAKSKLPLKITQKLGVKHPRREEIRRLIYSDDFLNLEEGWSYDQSGKNQMITLAEGDDDE